MSRFVLLLANPELFNFVIALFGYNKDQVVPFTAADLEKPHSLGTLSVATVFITDTDAVPSPLTGFNRQPTGVFEFGGITVRIYDKLKREPQPGTRPRLIIPGT